MNAALNANQRRTRSRTRGSKAIASDETPISRTGDNENSIIDSGRTTTSLISEIETDGMLGDSVDMDLANMGTALESMGTTGGGDNTSNFMDATSLRSLDADMNAAAAAGDGDKREEYSDDDEDAHISTPAAGITFQPLQPLPESNESRSTIQRSLRSQRKASTARAIPNAKTSTSAAQTTTSRTSSAAASPENGFMHNMTDPVAAAAGLPSVATSSSATELSHTPPTGAATSYETSHFAKRPRAGSLSERLRASSELEEKGIISRDQKGILKDLIISGQDNDIQHALDRYEQGDASVLEGMLQTGTLSNTAADEIDLLGDLNFDFLNVKEQATGMTTRSRGNSLASKGSIRLPPGSGAGNVQLTDDIGELDFDGGIGNWEQGSASRSRSNSTWSQLEHVLQQQRSRANSTVSIDLNNVRQRSNSLFSSLLGSETQDAQANYGRWMDPSGMPLVQAAADVEKTQEQLLLEQQHHHQQHFQQLLLQQQQQRRREEEEASARMEEEEELPPRKKPGRRASAPGSKLADKEHLKEQKKQERLLKKEQKEREKQERKEARELAKLEKQRKKAEGQSKESSKDKEEHIPGSGRPRSLSDPNLSEYVDDDGLMNVERPDGWIGAYSPESRKVRVARFLEKRNHRVWTKTVKYDVRKNFADSRLRVKGRFVKKEDELLMRELMSLT